MKRLLILTIAILLLLPSTGLAARWNEAASGTLTIYAIGDLPAASSVTAGTSYAVNDAASASDCTTGESTGFNICISNGTAYVVAGDGTGGSGTGSVTTIEIGDVEIDDDIVVIDFNESVFDTTESPEFEVNVTLDVVPSSGNATIMTTGGAVEVKYDPTDLDEGTTGLIFAASPTIATSLSIGANPADAGTGIRLSNTNVIEFEDTEGTGEVTALTVDASEVVIIGDANASGVTITPALTLSSTLTDGTATLTSGAWSGVATVDTGQGAYELYAMDQDVEKADTVQFGGIELGHVSDTTIARSGAGAITVEGVVVSLLGATIGASEVDADVATQAELDTVAALVDTDDEIIAIINASPSTYIDIAAGGTGVGTLTDGGVLLGNGTTDIQAMAVLTDGQMIVGDGTTDPVAESGATLRTSIGVGTGDSPQLTGIELGHATDTTLARSAAGAITVEGDTVILSGDTITGDVGVTFDTDGSSAATIADSVAVTSWNLTTPTITTGLTITGADADPAGAGNLRYDNSVAGVDGGALAWFDDDEIMYIADYPTPATDAEDDYHLAWDKDLDQMYWREDGTGGTTKFDAIGDPDGAGSVAFADEEKQVFSTAQDTAGSFLTIDNTVADVTGNVYLLELQHTDTADVDADFLKIVDGGGTLLTIQEGGMLSIGASPATTGIINLENAAVIAWLDATPATITHVDEFGIAFNLGIDVQGSAGITLENDETITNTGNGVILFTGNIAVSDAAPDLTMTDSTAGDGTGNILFASATAAADIVATLQADVANSPVTFITLHGTDEEVLFGKKIDIASLGIENVGAIADDGAITVISSGGTVTIEGVVFTGDAISSATTLAMAGALTGVTTATLTHTAPTITLTDSDDAAGTGHLIFASAETQDVIGYIQVDVGGAAASYIEIDGVSETVDVLKPLVASGDITSGDSFIIGSADIEEAELEILDGSSVTTAELEQLATLAATTISANQWAALGGLAETLSAAEINILDGVTNVTAAELTHISEVTSDIQAQIDGLGGDVTAVGDCASGACFGATAGDDASEDLYFEGSTGDAFELKLTTADIATADRTVTMRDATGTVLISGDTLTGEVTATFDTDGSTAATIADGITVDAWTLTAATVTASGAITASAGIVVANGQSLAFDESDANPNDADFTLTMDDGVLTATPTNGVNSDQTWTVDIDGTDGSIIYGGANITIHDFVADAVYATGFDAGEGNIANVGIAQMDTLEPDAVANGSLVIRGGQTATNTLKLQGYDVDGTAYVDVITITSANTVTMAITNATIDADSNTISNIDDGEIKASAGIDASKLADGTVSDAELQRLDGVGADLTTSLSTGTVTISTLLDVNESADFDFNANDEYFTVDNSAEYGANGAQVTITNADADVGAQMYLLSLDYSVDDNQANADFILAQDAGGEVYRLAQNGDVITTGLITSAGLTITTGNALTLGVVQWDDGSDNIDGEKIANDTIDDDSIDWSDVTAVDITMIDAGAITSTGAVQGTSLVASAGDLTITDTTPALALQDSDDAAGTATLDANSSGGTNDMILYIGVEDSSGAGTDYIEVDGVTETVDFLKPVVGTDATFTGTTTVSALTQAAVATPTWTTNDSTTSADGTFDVRVNAATAKYAGVMNIYVEEGDGAGGDGSETEALFIKINGSGASSTASGTIEMERITNFEMGLSVSNGTTGAGFVDIYEDEDNGSSYTRIQAASLASTYTLTLPTTDGNVNEILKTDGSGVLSWTTAGQATAWDDLVVPDTDETLNMAGYTTQWTWTETAADMFTIFATGAFGNFSVVRIEQKTGDPTDGDLLSLVTADAEAHVDNLVMANGTDDYVTHRIVDAGTYTIDVTSDGTAAVDIVDGLTVGSLTSDGTIAMSGALSGATTVTASTGFVLGNGDYIGVTSNEVITFATAGTIAVEGANLAVGTTSADDVRPTFVVQGDADTDSGGDTDEAFTLTLNDDATPTAALWEITSTQSAGYTFDKEVTFLNNAAAATFGDVTAETDVVLAFDGVTAQGSITYMEDEDRFDFDNDVDIVADLTAGTITSDAGVGGTTITASTGFALGDTDWIGIASNEIITFNAAGTVVFSGATVDFNNEDITSADKIEFVDTAIFIDGGTDTYLQIVADDYVMIGVDVAAYLEIDTADGSGTTISQTSDGVDFIDIGDTVDQVRIVGHTAGANDGFYDGIIRTYTVADITSHSFGQALHVDTDGTLIEADGDVASAGSMPAIGLLLAATDDGAKLILTQGLICEADWAWTIGGIVYVSDDPTTTEGLTQTAISTTGDTVQVVGVATHADCIEVSMGGYNLVEVP